jgi:hypothetical protein
MRCNGKNGIPQRSGLYMDRTHKFGGKSGKKRALPILNKAIRLVNRQLEVVDKQSPAPALYWTGSKVEWVEFNYALNDVKRLNNGKLSLKDQFHAMGEIFHFPVNDYARIFMDIKNRVKEERTKFLDILQQAEKQRMKEADRRPSRK